MEKFKVVVDTSAGEPSNEMVTMACSLEFPKGAGDIVWYTLRGIVDNALECYYGEPSTAVYISRDVGECSLTEWELIRTTENDGEESWTLWMDGEKYDGSRWDEYLSGWL